MRQMVWLGDGIFPKILDVGLSLLMKKIELNFRGIGSKLLNTVDLMIVTGAFRLHYLSENFASNFALIKAMGWNFRQQKRRNKLFN